MSGEIGKIREAIQRIAGTYQPGAVLFTAEVISVAETECTIMIGETKVSGVKLFSVEEAGNLLIKPVINTMVTVADLSAGQLRDLVIVKVDKVELIHFVQDGLTIEIDSTTGKVDIRNKEISFNELMQTMADIIKGLTVSTPAGPSGTPLPPTLQAVTKFETNFKKLLK